ncbi:MAG TPA: hypothetical protein DET40_19885 [Lentisphaeria bacterium]|nr:MAG: hypothetical protein A2X45_00875 [Lentisphaerae bacterium GWF2_50_93]HCE45811.1 hypothetical protein [Lentisphaeria bacterium]
MEIKKTMLMASAIALGVFASSSSTAQTPDGYPKVQANWEQCGWGGGSYYWSTAWHPTDENVIYMGSDCAGAYRSDDKGLHWKFTNNGISSYEVLCMAVSPAAPDLVWAMTSEGLCKSTDRAKTWELIPASGKKELDITCAKYTTIRSIAIDPKNADIVYAGSKTGKLFKTGDGGKTWKELPYRDARAKDEAAPAADQAKDKKSSDGACGIAVAPTNPSLVFAANTKHGVFRSQDAGATWKVLDTPKTACGVTVSPIDEKIVWAACGENGVYRSADGGNTWAAMNEGITKKVRMIEIVLHPSNPSLVYAIGNNGWSGYFFRSEDEGRKWTQNRKIQKRPDDRMPSPEVAGEKDGDTSALTNIAVNPKNPDEIFISANWTNVFSKDGGKTFECRQDEADNTCSTDIQFFGGKVYVTAMDEGLLVSENNGADWRQLIPLKWNKEISGHFWRVRIAKVGESVRIVTTSSPWDSTLNRTFRSEDDGKTFTVSTAGLPDYLPNINCMWGRSYPRSLAMDPKNPDILYLGMDGDPEPAKKLPGGGIFRSADGGKTWTRCAGQPGGLRLYYGLVVDPTDSKRLYFSSCGEGGGAWKSNDEGATWEHMFKDETWSFNLDVSPTGVVYVGSTNFWRSDDQGKTWKKLTDSKDGSTVVGIAIDPANEQRIWISRTRWDGNPYAGIFRTTDGGKNWEEITGDIPIRKQQLLRYNPETKELWSGGPGLFRLKQ